MQDLALKNWRIEEVVIQMFDAKGFRRMFLCRVGTTLVLALLGIFLHAHCEVSGATQEVPRIGAVRISGSINPVVAEFVAEQLDRVNRENAAAFLIELDTPGGLDSAMRQIIKSLLGSEIPVVVFVSPSGARGASAGALITLAADFAVMAPGTNLGAAHPVAIGGGQKAPDEVMLSKVVEDAAAYARSLAARRGRNEIYAEKMVRESLSISAEEALKHGVIDLIAEDVPDLLQKLDGRTYRRGDQQKLLHSRDASVAVATMNWRQKILNVISDPNVAYMLLMLGLLGVFFEISQPGVILPGAVGAIALLLALFAFQTLPVNYVGILLILLALVLFVLEVKVMSFGMLTVGGMISMTLGSLMLFDEHSEPFLVLSRAVIASTVLVTTGFCVLVLYFVVRTQRRQFVSGREGMAGLIGQALTEVHHSGQVFVRGEYWTAFCGEPIAAGEAIEVVRLTEDMRLEVRRVVAHANERAANVTAGSDKEVGK
jgi:membrane-bound serine protease (ClpP class)